ncbi:histidine phosphatase family protein [Echinicola shivajiensis]|uniref:histidine phosphatase family protein n=1 Tax=Echinicola shivajiensis TaxID=1035916 RepID=UPI001BFC8C36|nr:histidine phosphatase family protein [Echinicola shivajiensis]
MLKVYLLRHGETAYNAAGNKYCGRTDVGLTEKGIEQAKKVHQMLDGVEFLAAYSSPLERAFMTAKIIVPKMDVIRVNELIEVDFGNWEGKTRKEFVEENEEVWKDWEASPDTAKAGGNGETGIEVLERVNSFYEDLKNRHKNGNVLVVAHNGVNRLFMANQLGMPLKNYRRIVQENSAVTIVYLSGEEPFQLTSLNCRI